MSLKIDLENAAGPETPEPVRRARAYLLGEADAPGALPDEVAEALCEALVRREDAARLTALAALPDKALAKRARRGIHVLRTRGLHVDVPRQGAPRPAFAAPAAEAPPPSAMSMIAQDGEQLVWLALGRDDGQVEVFEVFLTADRGLVSCNAVSTSRKNWRSMTQDMYALEKASIAPVPADHARWLIEDGARRATALGRVLPREYERARLGIGAAPAHYRHPAEEAIPAEAVAEAARHPERFPEALQLPETARWLPPEEETRRMVLRLQEIETSRLLLDERQRGEQRRETVARAVREMLAGPWREHLVHALRETAYLVVRRAEVGKRGRDYLGDAALLLAAAHHAADPATAPDDIAIASRLGERVLAIISGAAARRAGGAEGPSAPPADAPGGLSSGLPSGLIVPSLQGLKET